MKKEVEPVRKRVQINILHLLFLLLLLIGGGWLLLRWLLPVDQKDRIAARINEISEFAAKRGQEGIAVNLAQSKDLSEVAWNSVNVKLDEFRFDRSLSREEIVKMFSTARQQITTIDVDFYDIVITLEGENRASAKGTVVIEITGIRDVFDEAGDVQMKWILSPEDDQWYLCDVYIRPVLSHNFNR